MVKSDPRMPNRILSYVRIKPRWKLDTHPIRVLRDKVVPLPPLFLSSEVVTI